MGYKIQAFNCTPHGLLVRWCSVTSLFCGLMFYEVCINVSLTLTRDMEYLIKSTRNYFNITVFFNSELYDSTLLIPMAQQRRAARRGHLEDVCLGL